MTLPHRPEALSEESGEDDLVSDEIFRNIFYSISCASVIFDENMRIVRANHPFIQMIGLDERTCEGTTLITEIFKKSDLEIALNEQKRRQKEGDLPPKTHDLRLNDHAGKIHNFIANISPIQGTDFWVLTGFDVTSHVQAREIFRKHEDQFRLLSKNARDILFHFEFSPEPHFAFISPSVEQVTGYSLDEWYENPRLIESIIHPDDRSSLHNLRTGAVDWEKPVIIRWKHRDGHIVWGEGLLAPVYESEGALAGVEGIIRDSTGKISAEEELKRQQRELLDHIKALNCLYAIHSLVHQKENSIDDIARQTVSILCSSCAAPQLTCARIVIEDKAYPTDNWKETPWRVVEDIHTVSDPRAHIEVGYVEHPVRGEEDPFCTEERQLFTAVAAILGEMIDHRRAEERLKKNEEELRIFLDALPESALLLEPDGTVVAINEAALTRINIELPQIIGANVFDYLPEDIAERRKEHVAQVVRTKNSVYFTDHPEGRILHHQLFPVFGVDGGVEYIAIVAIDDTDYRLMERALKKSEERYRTFFEFSPEPVFVLCDGRISFANPAAVQILGGQQTGDVVGILYTDFVHKDDGQIVGEAIQKSLENNRPSSLIEHRVIRIDGEESVLEARIVPTLFEGNQALQIISRDVSFRKEAEKSVRMHNRQLSIINHLIRVANSSLILEEMMEIIMKMTMELMNFDSGGVYLKDPDAKTVKLISFEGFSETFHEKMAKINIHDWPYNVVFLGGQPHYVDNTPDDPPGMIDARLLEEGELLSFAAIPIIADSVVLGGLCLGRKEQCGFSAKEKSILELIGKEIGGTIFRGMLQDRLEEAYEEATRYLDIMEQDIKTASNNLAQEAELIKEMLHGPAQEYADKLLISCQQIHQIVNNVAIIRRITQETIDYGPVDLDSVIDEVIRKFSGADIHYRQTGFSVLADDMIVNIFSNLIENSLLHGGPDVKIWIAAVEDEGFIRVSVEDTGSGIPDEQKHDILNFATKKKPLAPGKGLGLYVVSMLVERYGGTIWLEDRISGKKQGGLAIRFMLVPYED